MVQPCSSATAACRASATNLPPAPRDPAQPVENGHVARPRTGNAGGRPFREPGHEGDCRIQRGGRVEHAGVGHDAKEPGNDENRQGERFRSGRLADEPIRLPVMFGVRVLDVRIDGDIDLRKQHGESALAIPRFLVLGIERTRSVEIDTRARTDAAHRHQPVRRRLGGLSLLERIVRSRGTERAHADTLGADSRRTLLASRSSKGIVVPMARRIVSTPHRNNSHCASSRYTTQSSQSTHKAEQIHHSSIKQ